MISPGDIWTLIGWHLSFWGCKCHQAARPDSLVLLCSAMKKGNRPTTLAYSDNFSLNCLAKNYNSNKNHMGAAALWPTWCLQSTLSTLQAWKKVQRFCEPDNCLLLFGSHASNVRQPSGPVPGAAAVRVHHRPVRCSQDTFDWRQTGEPSLLPAINTKGDGSN